MGLFFLLVFSSEILITIILIFLSSLEVIKTSRNPFPLFTNNMEIPFHELVSRENVHQTRSILKDIGYTSKN